MRKGFIAIHRELADHELWRGEKFSRGQAWIDLILLAAHADHVVNGREVKRGQLLTTFRYLANRWKWSTGAVTRFFSYLEGGTQIVSKRHRERDTGGTLITILNYAKYQDLREQNADDRDTDGTQNETQKSKKRDYHNHEQTTKDTEQLLLAVGDDPSLPASVPEVVVEAWNALGRPFPHVMALPDKRRSALKQRLGDPVFREGWRRALEVVAKSSFHRGENDRRWVANLDWFIRPDTVVKLLERASAPQPTTADNDDWCEDASRRFGKSMTKAEAIEYLWDGEDRSGHVVEPEVQEANS